MTTKVDVARGIPKLSAETFTEWKFRMLGALIYLGIPKAYVEVTPTIYDKICNNPPPVEQRQDQVLPQEQKDEVQVKLEQREEARLVVPDPKILMTAFTILVQTLITETYKVHGR